MANEYKTIYTIVRTQVYDGETLETDKWVFSTKEKAWKFYKKLIEFSNKELNETDWTSEWVDDDDNFENIETCNALWGRYEDGYYLSNHIEITLDDCVLDQDFDELYGEK